MPKKNHTQLIMPPAAAVWVALTNAGRFATAQTGIGAPPLIARVAPLALHAVTLTGLPLVSFRNRARMLPLGQTPDSDPLLQSIAAGGGATV